MVGGHGVPPPSSSPHKVEAPPSPDVLPSPSTMAPMMNLQSIMTLQQGMNLDKINFFKTSRNIIKFWINERKFFVRILNYYLFENIFYECWGVKCFLKVLSVAKKIFNEKKQ